MSIVYLVVKLRLSPPTADATPAQKTEDALEDADAAKKRVRASDAKDYAFLTSKLDAEELPAGADTTIGWAHAPHWPARRRPGWWMVLADDKSNRVVVPPMRLADVPFARPDAPAGRDYRSYKLQFQAPQNVGVYTWKLYLVSDSYVGEELERAITVCVARQTFCAWPD
jgi:translocation protein SEC63